jgi:hypothetical protein
MLIGEADRGTSLGLTWRTVRITITTIGRKGDHLQEIGIQYWKLPVGVTTILPGGFEETVLFSKGK